MGLYKPIRSLGCLLLIALVPCHASVTVYTAKNQIIFATTTTSNVPASEYTGAQAYNPSTLIPPPVPTPAMPTSVPVALQSNGTTGLSVTQGGDFFGFSIEMSVSNQLLGKNSTLIQVPFLNLMASIQQRGGGVRIRVGGNSQEAATLVDSIPDGRILTKNLTGATNPTDTPPLEYTRDLLYMMRNISSLVNIHWIIGVPWYVTTPFNLAIVSAGQEILGDYMIGLQCANEPDLYAGHEHRNDSYGPLDYVGEISDFLAQMTSENTDPSGRASTLLVTPNINGRWMPESVWDTGFVDTYSENIEFLSVEKYPQSNCGAAIGDGEPILDPQTVFPEFLTHQGHIDELAPFLNSTAFAQEKGKRFLMMETNQASCGGILGISNTFGAALWGLDYALQLAYSNFSGAFFHAGGQHVFYNPFTSPPTNESTFHQWSIGPLYYSALAMAEAMGTSNTTQVLDLTGSVASSTGNSNTSAFTPVYGIYENGAPVRVAAFNYVDDPSGASNVTFSISVGGGSVPAQVKVKYLAAPSVSTMGGYTWAGQTLGGYFASDGRLMGTEDIQTVPCDTNAQTCAVTVPAPGFALVFLTDELYSQAAASNSDAGPMTFPTTARTAMINTAMIDPSVLATSNGNNGSLKLGSTDKAGLNDASRRYTSSVVVAISAGLTVGVGLLLR